MTFADPRLQTTFPLVRATCNHKHINLSAIQATVVTWVIFMLTWALFRPKCSLQSANVLHGQSKSGLQANNYFTDSKMWKKFISMHNPRILSHNIYFLINTFLKQKDQKVYIKGKRLRAKKHPITLKVIRFLFQSQLHIKIKHHFIP